MNALLPILGLVLSLVEQITPQAATIAKIIQTLETIISVGSELVTAVYPAVKNIIEALKGKDGVSQSDLDALAVLEKKWDDAFDAAAKDEGIDDETADPPPGQPES